MMLKRTQPTHIDFIEIPQLHETLQFNAGLHAHRRACLLIHTAETHAQEPLSRFCYTATHTAS